MSVMLGARWDDPVQNERMVQAHRDGRIDYIEVNYPIPYEADPHAFGIPILAHTSSNPTCSVHGINPSIARLVRDGAETANSPWIGEHLTWLGTAGSGSLGYQINPLFIPEVKEVSVSNIKKLREFYGRTIALELSPIYVEASDYESEMHFLGDVAIESDSLIILDVTHWDIANRNLEREDLYGLDALPAERIVELHVAGMRQGSDGFWHDAHQVRPNEAVLALTERLVRDLPGLRAVTFEHHAEAPAEDFDASLADIAGVIGHLRPA